MKENSSPVDGGDADKDVGGSKQISNGSAMIIVGGLGGDARGGKFPLCFAEKSKFPSRLICRDPLRERGTTQLRWMHWIS